jgi:hypothetical protein
VPALIEYDMLGEVSGRAELVGRLRPTNLTLRIQQTPLTTRFNRYEDPLGEAFLEAGAPEALDILRAAAGLPEHSCD